jgi:hypothetical protein
LQDFIFGSRNRSPYLNVLTGFVGGAQTVEPQRNFARFLLMMYLLFCLVKRSLYQGALFQFLQMDDRHSAVQSIDEVVELNFRVFMLPSSLEHTQNMKFRDRYRNLICFCTHIGIAKLLFFLSLFLFFLSQTRLGEFFGAIGEATGDIEPFGTSCCDEFA